MLLKIVQGPNAGAEIILADGMTVSLGKGDACDILLADQSIADIACELEVNDGRVRMLLPGGAEERLEPYHVRFLGETTAIAIGPETGTWDELIWPTRGATVVAEEASEEDAPSQDDEAANQTNSKSKRRRGWGCFVVVLLLLLLLMGIGACVLMIFCWPKCESLAQRAGVSLARLEPMVQVVQKTYDRTYQWIESLRTPEVEEVIPVVVPDISEVAATYGLTCEDDGNKVIVSGNFVTRAERLAVTATLYATKPGVTLNLSDDESLRMAAQEVLALVSEGKLEVHSATNRVISLEGYSPSSIDLQAVLKAILSDVPYVLDIDCSRVRLGEATGIVAVVETPAAEGVTGVQTSRVRAEKRKAVAPKMPVVGVVTMPYPCIVLKDGSRITEGAEFGGFIIETISADIIRVKGPDGTFEWRP